MCINNMKLGWTGFILSLLIIQVLQTTECVPSGDSFKLRTRALRPYRGYFTYVISDFREIFSDVLPRHKYNTFQFSTETEPEVKWYINLLFNTKTTIQLNLFVKSLPSDIDQVYGYVDCGVFDSKGKKVKFYKTRSAITSNYFFSTPISLNELSEKVENLLPNEQLTIFLDVKGILLPKEKNASQLITEPIREDVKALDCANEIVLNTVDKERSYETHMSSDVTLRSETRQFKCKLDLIKERMPRFELFVGMDVDGGYSFTEQVSPDELEDMVNFMYNGTAFNLDKTCRSLYKVAGKFGFECLQSTCEELLIGQVKATNAREFTDLARKIGSARLEKMSAFCIYRPDDEKC